MFDIIKEYLVGLGVQIDQPGFNQFDATLKKTDQKIASSSAAWSRDFKKAGIGVAAAIGSIVAATGGLLQNIAKTDMEMEKYARSMMMGKEAATSMNFALKAMGESVENVRMIPELRKQFQGLIQDSRKMSGPSDMQQELKNMRSIIFEFTRMKQEAAYAMNWVGYYIMKNFAGPLKDLKKGFTSFNDRIIHDMPKWTAKVASFITSVINIGTSAFRLVKDVGSGLKDMWDTFPKGVKIAMASLGIFFAFLNMSPVGRFMTLVSGLLLLVEDFYGYLDGKDAAMGPLWQKMIDGAERAKPHLQRFFADFKSDVEDAKDAVKDWYRALRESEDMERFGDMLKELGTSFADLGETIVTITIASVADFWEYLKDIKTPARFKKAIDENKEAVLSLGKGFANAGKELTLFLKKMEGNPRVKSFWEEIEKVLGYCLNRVMDNISAIGIFGQAVGELWQGHFKEAARLAWEAIKTREGMYDERELEEYGSSDGFSDESSDDFSGTNSSDRDKWIREASKKYGVPANKIAAMMSVESSFNPKAVSKAGAIGYMQLVPDTFKSLGFKDIHDPRQNILAGTKYMKQLYERYGTWDATYAAYNWGPGHYDAYLAGEIKTQPKETRDHVVKVKTAERKYSAKDKKDKSSSAPYRVQNGVEDQDLSGVNAGLRRSFSDLAHDLERKGYQVEVTSGQRSPKNNAAVNGAKNSAHLGNGKWGTGQAVDFVIKGDFDNKKVKDMAQHHGLKVIYHDAGSGLHFHVEKNNSDKKNKPKTPKAGSPIKPVTLPKAEGVKKEPLNFFPKTQYQYEYRGKEDPPTPAVPVKNVALPKVSPIEKKNLDTFPEKQCPYNGKSDSKTPVPPIKNVASSKAEPALIRPIKLSKIEQVPITNAKMPKVDPVKVVQMFTPADLRLAKQILQGGRGSYSGTSQVAAANTSNITCGDINIEVKVDQPAATGQEIATETGKQFKSQMGNLALFRNLGGLMA